jgi:hypothetical protein
LAFDWNRGLLPQLYDGLSDGSKQRVKSALTGKGFFEPENASANAEMRYRQSLPLPGPDMNERLKLPAPPSLPLLNMDMPERLRTPDGLRGLAPPMPPGSALAAVANQLSPHGLPSQTVPQAAPQAAIGPDMNERIRSPLELQAPQMANAPPWMRINSQAQADGTFQRNYYTPQGTASGLSHVAPGHGLTVMDQGNGGTTEGNVAALNQQLAAVRSLNEARGIYGAGGFPSPGGLPSPGDNRAFGDLVSIGGAGGRGDDVMARDRFMRQFDQNTKSGRQGLLQAQDLMDKQAQWQAGQHGYRQPSPAGADPYKMAELGLDQRKLGLEQLKFGLDQQNQRFNQGQTAALNDSLIGLRRADAQPKPLSESQVRGGLMQHYLTTLQNSQSQNLSPQDRANATAQLGLMNGMLQAFSTQQKEQDAMTKLEEEMRKASNGMRE